jgi:hypothetical protein
MLPFPKLLKSSSLFIIFMLYSYQNENHNGVEEGQHWICLRIWHVDTRCHFVREYIEDSLLGLSSSVQS